MRKRRVKIKKLTTKQLRAMQNTIENRCCNYLSERCVLYDIYTHLDYSNKVSSANAILPAYPQNAQVGSIGQ